MLVIAAPHSKCKGPHRDCDTDAKQITLMLAKKARRAGIKTTGCLANKYRHEVDNNREGSEGSDFRRDLDRSLQSKGLFLEIHSHPNIGRFNGKRMTIFNLPKNGTIAKKLYKFLNDDTVGIQDGESVMDIQQKYKGLMLEFNEGFPYDDLLDNIIKFVKTQEPAQMKHEMYELNPFILFTCIFCTALLLLIICMVVDTAYGWLYKN